MEDVPRRLVDLVEDRLATASMPSAADAEVVAWLRAELEDAARAACASVQGRPGVLPLRLPKARLLALADCQRFAVAVHGSPAAAHPGPELVAGSALDRYVVHELLAGPVGDPVEDLRSMLRAEAEHELAAEVAALDDAPARLSPLAAAAAAFRGVDAAWWPRAQTRAGVELAGGDVVSTGRVDVEVGGPAAGRPGLVVEVKSAGLRGDHLAEVRHYSLLVALRDGVPPALAACWSPVRQWAVEEVTPAVLASAAARLADGIVDWAGLVAGAVPAESPGPRCRWCPDADRCPSVAGDDTEDAGGSEPWEHEEEGEPDAW